MRETNWFLSKSIALRFAEKRKRPAKKFLRGLMSLHFQQKTPLAGSFLALMRTCCTLRSYTSITTGRIIGRRSVFWNKYWPI